MLTGREKQTNGEKKDMNSLSLIYSIILLKSRELIDMGVQK